MGIWREKVLPRVIDKALGTDEVAVWRKRCVEGLTGVVVEPGFGSGLNLPHYPAEVTRVYAVDPAVVGRDLAADRMRASDVEVEFVGLDGEDLPLDDNSCDSALLTLTLCTIPDAPRALGELRRVLKPHGALHFVEHGLAPDASVERWQHRLTPVQRRVFDGCHLNRPIAELITDSGFTMDWVESKYARGPKPVSWFTVGRALSP